MTKATKKIGLYFTLFGIFCVLFNLYELFTNKYSTNQGIIFVVESLLGIILIYLPNVVTALFKRHISTTIIIFYWFFLFISVFVGTSLHVMSIISFWDKVLHLVSPMLLTIIGYGIARELLIKVDIKDISPWLFLLFGLAFASLCGIVWEFWEFLCDSIGQMNLQRYNLSNGTPLMGREALMDTMGDLFTNTIGAILMGIYSFVKFRNDKTYFERYQFEKINKK